jgi:hypothetical protein
VSAVTVRLGEESQAFTRRDLSGFAVESLVVDAIYESLRLQQRCRAAVSILGKSYPLSRRGCWGCSGVGRGRSTTRASSVAAAAAFMSWQLASVTKTASGTPR